MKFGLLYEMQRPSAAFEVDHQVLIEETLEQCVLADEVGFDYLWFVEHHFLTTFSGSSAPEVILSALARMTSRIRLGFGVVILPNHYPVQVAERVAMVDHLSGGRVESGVGRSTPYEQVGLGNRPEGHPRDHGGVSPYGAEDLEDSGPVLAGGKSTSTCRRGRYLPKPRQDPHPPIWMACTQPSSYEIAAGHGVGVLSFGSGAPAGMKEHVDRYRQNIEHAEPVGSFVNNQWANFTLGHCGDNNTKARELGARAIKEFFGPNRPYTADRKEVYDRLLESWGGVPDHLQSNFQRFIGGEQDLGGGGVPRAMLGELPADLLCERGVIVAGDPDSCIECVKRHQEVGVDQTLLIMQSDQIPHEKAMRSIKLFGEEVIPAFR